jgi:hypothetical protein
MKNKKSYIDWLTYIAHNTERQTEGKEFEQNLRELNQSTYSELGDLADTIKQRRMRDE